MGSGAGGATAAVTLARLGAEVTVVEAGPFRRPKDYPSSIYGGMRDMMDDWGNLITRGRAFWPVVQARLVGGTTVINSAICVRTPGDILETWERDHGIGGKRFERRILSHQDDLETALSVETVPLGARGRSNELAAVGSDAMKYDGHVMRRYTKNCEGTAQCLQGCRKNRKQSTNVTFIPEMLRLGGKLLSSAPVQKVEFVGSRANAVVGRFVSPNGEPKRRGGRFRVRARKGVIIAASATHTPALLLRSGVRSRALGKYFRSHPGTGIFGVYDDPIDMVRGATQGWASTRFRDDPGLKLETLALPPELVASRLAGGGTQLMRRVSDYRHLALWVQGVRAESVGTVRAGLGGKPVVKYTMNQRDMLRLRQGNVLIAKQHFAAGARSIIPGVYGMPYELGPDQLNLLEAAPLDPRAYVAILSHLFGGAVMGSDPDRSVTDASGRVRGYRHLYVADASLMPTNLGVNPQNTIMALGAMVAEDAVEEDQKRASASRSKPPSRAHLAS